MSKAQSGSADGRLTEQEVESAAVQSGTDTAKDQDDAKTGTTEPVEGETVALTDTGDAEEVTDSTEAPSDDSAADEDSDDSEPVQARRRINWSRVISYGVLPVLALLLALSAGYVKWHDSSVRSSGIAGVESVAAAKDATVAMLSYQSDTAEKDLGAARDRLTGAFKDSYTQLIHDVVIPAARQQHISAVASVPAAASVSATPNHAVVLLFVNQTIVVGTDAPSDTASRVRVNLDRIDKRWLVSGFDPI